METAVVCSMSAAAAGTLAIAGYSHVKSFASGTLQKVRDIPIHHADIFAHPVDHLIASKRDAAPLGAKLSCKIGDRPAETLYVVLTGEVLLGGPNANVEEFAYALGGTRVSFTDCTVSIHGKHIDSVSLSFTDAKEASLWAAELKRATSISLPGKRIDELVSDIFRQEKEISGLQDQLTGLQREYDKCSAALDNKQQTEDDRKTEEYVKDLEQRLDLQCQQTRLYKLSARRSKLKEKKAIPAKIHNSLTSIQDLLTDLEERGIAVPGCTSSGNGVASGFTVDEHRNLNEPLVSSQIQCRGLEEKSLMFEKPDTKAEHDHSKSKVAELEGMLEQKEKELGQLRGALAQLEAAKVQLPEYRDPSQNKEKDLAILHGIPADESQHELILQFQNQIVQYETALQQKERELEAAIKPGTPEQQSELTLQLQNQIAQYEEVLQRKVQELQATAGMQNQIVQYESALEQKEKELQTTTLEFQHNIAQYEAALQQKEQQLQGALTATSRDVQPPAAQDEITQLRGDFEFKIAQYQTALQQKEQQLQEALSATSRDVQSPAVQDEIIQLQEQAVQYGQVHEQLQNQILQYEAALKAREHEMEMLRNVPREQEDKIAQYETALQQKEQQLHEALTATSRDVQSPAIQDELIQLREQVVQNGQIHEQLQNQILQYEDALQAREHEMEMLRHVPREQEDKIAQYETALQQKEQQLQEALTATGRDVQSPAVQDEIIQLREQAVQYGQVHEQLQNQILQYEDALQAREHEMEMLRNVPREQEDKIAQYETALQQKEQELQEALTATSRDVQSPAVQDEIVQLREQAVQYGQVHEQLQNQILQYEDALKAREHEMEMLRKAVREQQDDLAQQIQNQAAQFEALLAEKNKQHDDRMTEAAQESLTLLKRAEHELQRANGLETEVQVIRQRNAEIEAMLEDGASQIADLEAKLKAHESGAQGRSFDTMNQLAALEAELAIEQDRTRQANERAAELKAKEFDTNDALQKVTGEFRAERISLESDIQTAKRRVASLEAELLQVQEAEQKQGACIDQLESSCKALEAIAQERGQLAASLEAELQRVAEEGGVNQEAIMSRALEAENKLDAMAQHHEQEKALLRDELTQKFERNLAHIREEAARSESDAREASRQATLVAQEHAALASEREQDVQRLTAENQNLDEEKNVLLDRVVQVEQQYEHLLKEFENQQRAFDGDRENLKLEVTRKNAEANASSKNAAAVAQERDKALKKLSELELRLAATNKKTANMVNNEELLAVKKKLAHCEASAGDFLAKWKQAEQDLTRERQTKDEKTRSFEAELVAQRGHAAALRSERDVLQQELSQQTQFSTELQEAIASHNPEVIGQLEEDNQDLKQQLNLALETINENRRKIEEERSSFYKELETVRRTATTRSTVASEVPRSKVPSVQTAVQLPTGAIRNPGFTSEAGVRRVNAPLMQPLGSPVHTAVNQGPVTAVHGMNSIANSPVMLNRRAGTSARVSAMPPSSSPAPGVSNVQSPAVRPLSFDRVSNIRSYQPPHT